MFILRLFLYDMWNIFRYNKEEIFDIFTTKSLDRDWKYCLIKLLVSKIIVESNLCQGKCSDKYVSMNSYSSNIFNSINLCNIIFNLEIDLDILSILLHSFTKNVKCCFYNIKIIVYQVYPAVIQAELDEITNLVWIENREAFRIIFTNTLLYKANKNFLQSTLSIYNSCSIF